MLRIPAVMHYNLVEPEMIKIKRKKLSNSGFGAVGIIVAIVIFACIGGVGYYIYSFDNTKVRTKDGQPVPTNAQDKEASNGFLEQELELDGIIKASFPIGTSVKARGTETFYKINDRGINVQTDDGLDEYIISIRYPLGAEANKDNKTLLDGRVREILQPNSDQKIIKQVVDYEKNVAEVELTYTDFVTKEIRYEAHRVVLKDKNILEIKTQGKNDRPRETEAFINSFKIIR